MFYKLYKLKKFYFVLLVLLVLTAFASFTMYARADTGRYLIDFGLSSQQSTNGWNNITGNNANNTTTVYQLVDSAGGSTGVTFRLTDGFNCAPNGIPAVAGGTTASTLYPGSATVDYIFLGVTSGGVCTQNDTTAAFVLQGLSQNAVYDIRFYASRIGDTINRTTNYTVGSTTVSLNPSGNVNNYAVISDVAPVNGAINVTIAKAPTSLAFGYIGVVEIIKKTTSNPPTANAGSDQTITLPSHSVTLTGSGTDSDGTISSYSWTEISSNSATIGSPNSATTTVTDLAAGTYTFRLTVTDNDSKTATDDVIVTVNPQSIGSCPAKKVIILGSSTAVGTGANPASNAWANKFTAYLQQLNSSNSVVNLAVGGYTTYDIMPTGSTPPAGRPAPNTSRNITAAIAQNPHAIIVNLPSGDMSVGYSVSEIEANYEVIADAAADAGIPIWIATKQPRTLGLDQTGRDNQMILRDWILATYASNAFDFWTTLANSNGTINSLYDADGVHLNNLGHQKLYSRVVGSNLVESLCTQGPQISSVSSTPVVSETVNWTTDVPASSRVEYGTTTSYGTMTAETNTSPRVTTHTVTIPNLTACTTYHYRVRSKDTDQNERVGISKTFTTLCN